MPSQPSAMGHKKRPKLSSSISLSQFSSFYWLKAELIRFCSEHQISTAGSKVELTNRVKRFIETGIKERALSNSRVGISDSKSVLTVSTPVINFKNDAITRAFFVGQIGDHFRFNSYLRQFRHKENSNEALTYGDLIQGWLHEEKCKKSPGSQTKIESQFEYNQFTRDFFVHEESKTRSDCVKAWKAVKAEPGPNTYAYFKKKIQQV